MIYKKKQLINPVTVSHSKVAEVYYEFEVIMLLIIFLTIQMLTFEIGVDGANILACLTSASQSHHILETAILEELANRGHNVN